MKITGLTSNEWYDIGYYRIFILMMGTAILSPLVIILITFSPSYPYPFLSKILLILCFAGSLLMMIIVCIMDFIRRIENKLGI